MIKPPCNDALLENHFIILARKPHLSDFQITISPLAKGSQPAYHSHESRLARTIFADETVNIPFADLY